MIVWPEISTEWENFDQYANTEAKNAAYNVFKSLDEITPDNLGVEIDEDQVPGLRFAPDAQELFYDFRAALELRIRGGDGTSAAFESHIAKYRSLMPSLALIFHLVDVVQGQATGPVSLQSARLAAEWCDYLERHASKVYAAELYPELTAAHLLAKKIRTGAVTDEMPVRALYRNEWSGLTTPEAVRDGIRILEKGNMVRITRMETGGRPTDIIRLHPALERVAA